MAQILGKSDDSAKVRIYLKNIKRYCFNVCISWRQYKSRAGNFANVWNPNITVPGGPESVRGMMQVFKSVFSYSRISYTTLVIYVAPICERYIQFYRPSSL